MLRTKKGGKKSNSLVIRLRQKGQINYRLFDIVLVKNTKSNSGFIIERLGFFNPNITERYLVYDSERIGYWTKKGAFVHFNVKKLIIKALIY